MSQSKKKSFFEACVNTLIGYLTTLAFSPMIYKACGVTVSNGQMGAVVLCFTVLSVARSYVIRRWFNKKDSPKPHDGPCEPELMEYKRPAWGSGMLIINKCHCGKVISEKRVK